MIQQAILPILHFMLQLQSNGWH